MAHNQGRAVLIGSLCALELSALARSALVWNELEQNALAQSSVEQGMRTQMKPADMQWLKGYPPCLRQRLGPSLL